MRDYHYDDDDVKNDHRYSWRKRYQRGYGEESASPLLKEYLDNIRSEREMSEEEHDDDYQHKYVGYVLLSLVLGVVGMGVLGLIYMLNWAEKCPIGICP